MTRIGNLSCMSRAALGATFALTAASFVGAQTVCDVQLDDGDAGPNAIGGANSALAWGNAIDLDAEGCDTINAIGVGFGTSAVIGNPVTIVVQDDPNDDGDPSDIAGENLLCLKTTIQPPGASGVAEYELDEPLDVSGLGVIFVTAVTQSTADTFPAAFDIDTQLGVAFFDTPAGVNCDPWAAGTASPISAIEGVEGGTWMIRLISETQPPQDVECPAGGNESAEACLTDGTGDNPTEDTTNGSCELAEPLLGCGDTVCGTASTYESPADLDDDGELDTEEGGASCPEDIAPTPDGDGTVGVPDLLELLSQWGGDGSGDLDDDGTVGVSDLLQMLSAWGACEGGGELIIYELRDIDLYSFSIEECQDVTLTTNTEFAGIVQLLETSDCENTSVVATQFTNATSAGTLETTLGPGEYSVLVTTNGFTGFECTDGVGNEYTVEMSCGEPTDLSACPGGSCTSPQPIAIGESLEYDNTDNPDATFPSCAGFSPNGPTVWFEVIGDGTTLTADTCDPDSFFNTIMAVYCNNCETPLCVDSNDDQGFNECPNGASSKVEWCSEEGRSYFIAIWGLGGSTGSGTLTVTSDGAACKDPAICDPEGACCLPDGNCIDSLTPGACADMGGTFTDADVQCQDLNCEVFSATYQYDDGMMENALGLTEGGDILWIHRFDAEGGADTVTELFTAWSLEGGTGGPGVEDGDPFEWGIYNDDGDDSDPTTSTALITGSGTVDGAFIANDTFQTIDVPDTMVEGSFYVAIKVSHDAGEFPAPMDESGSNPGDAWVAGDGAGAFDITDLNSGGLAPTDLTAAGFPAFWGLRATGTE